MAALQIGRIWAFQKGSQAHKTTRGKLVYERNGQVKGKVRVRVEVKFRVRFSTRCGHIAGAHREGQGGFGLPGGGQGLGQNTASSKTLSADASQDFSGLLGRKLIAWVHLVGCVRLLLSFPTS